jgi:hypothetical protein
LYVRECDKHSIDVVLPEEFADGSEKQPDTVKVPWSNRYDKGYLFQNRIRQIIKTKYTIKMIPVLPVPFHLQGCIS